MITLTWVLVLAGFWLCYQTSKRAQLATATNRLEQCARVDRKKGQLSGVFGLTLGLMLALYTFGIGSGAFIYVIMLSVIASMVIILAPLGFITKSQVIIVVLVSLSLELAL